MEPIPETIRAIEELGPFADGGASAGVSPWILSSIVASLVLNVLTPPPQ